MRVLLLIVSFLASSMTLTYSASAARLVTFQFEAVRLLEPSAAFFPVPLGTRVSGSYTFDLDTPAANPPSTTTFTRYSNAIRVFNLEMEGFGEGSGFDGDILIGAPVRTSGSSNFFSDQYVASSFVSGITLSTTIFGSRNLISAAIRLRDLDREGIDTVELSETPLDLAFFLDNTGPTPDSDNAELILTFDTANGGINSNAFRLTSLTLVPEPSAIALVLLCAWPAVSLRLNRNPV